MDRNFILIFFQILDSRDILSLYLIKICIIKLHSKLLFLK